MDERALSREDVLEIRAEDCPMMVFSYGIGDFISAAIVTKTHGFYNHFMWLLEPGVLATQDWWFRKIPVEKYLDRHLLKFVYGINWGPEERAKITASIEADLARPWYQNIYDLPAIVGQMLDIKWLQTPGIEICSDKAKHLNDPDYTLKHANPTDVNIYTKTCGKYAVYGRFRPD